MKDKITNIECREFGVNDLWINLTYNGKKYVGCITEENKQVDLDDEFDKWYNENISDLEEEWNNYRLNEKFDEFIEERWREYQERNGLIDKSNEGVLK